LLCSIDRLLGSVDSALEPSVGCHRLSNTPESNSNKQLPYLASKAGEKSRFYGGGPRESALKT